MATRFPVSLRARATLLAGAALAAGGLTAGAQVFEVDNDLVAGRTRIQAGMASGSALVAGDLDGDGRPELVLGEPCRDEAEVDSGGVSMVSAAAGHGLAQRIGIAGVGFETASGRALAMGDFDGDGALELAVGEPGAEVGGARRAGRVRIWEQLFGAVGWRELDRGSAAVAGAGAEGDEFAVALAVGDFDGDGFDDLALGAPGQDAGTIFDAGAVYVLYGDAQGLDGAGSDFWVLGAGGLPAAASASARFGSALAAGDFDGDGFDDLAIGAPGTDLADPVPSFDVGRVVVLRGGAEGLAAAAALALLEGDLSFGVTEPGDRFGSALAAGDFDRGAECVAAGSCADELAIGVPGEDPGDGTPSAGKVMVLPGVFDAGLAPDRTRSFTAFLFGREVEGGARFGESLAVGQLGGGRGDDRADDLAIGEPRRDFEAGDEGMVYVLFGRADLGLAAARSQQLTARAGLASAPARAGDRFGAALAIADLDGDGHGDLAIGIPGRDLTVHDAPRPDAGAVQVLWGALFADGFERGTTAGWDLF